MTVSIHLDTISTLEILTGRFFIHKSLIGIRPSTNNRSMVIQDPELREQVGKIAHELLGGVEWE